MKTQQQTPIQIIESFNAEQIALLTFQRKPESLSKMKKDSSTSQLVATMLPHITEGLIDKYAFCAQTSTFTLYFTNDGQSR